MVLRSAARDRERFPGAGEYEVALPAPAHDVVDARVADAHVPDSAATVDASNDALAFVGGRVPVRVPHGHYRDAADLAKAAAEALETAAGAAASRGARLVNLSPAQSFHQTGRVALVAAVPFALDARATTAAAWLGFAGARPPRDPTQRWLLRSVEMGEAAAASNAAIRRAVMENSMQLAARESRSVGARRPPDGGYELADVATGPSQALTVVSDPGGLESASVLVERVVLTLAEMAMEGRGPAPTDGDVAATLQVSAGGERRAMRMEGAVAADVPAGASASSGVHVWEASFVPESGDGGGGARVFSVPIGTEVRVRVGEAEPTTGGGGGPARQRRRRWFACVARRESMGTGAGAGDAAGVAWGGASSSLSSSPPHSRAWDPTSFPGAALAAAVVLRPTVHVLAAPGPVAPRAAPFLVVRSQTLEGVCSSARFAAPVGGGLAVVRTAPWGAVAAAGAGAAVCAAGVARFAEARRRVGSSFSTVDVRLARTDGSPYDPDDADHELVVLLTSVEPDPSRSGAPFGGSSTVAGGWGAADPWGGPVEGDAERAALLWRSPSDAARTLGPSGLADLARHGVR